MDKENAILHETEIIDDEAFDLDELEEKLQNQLEEELSDLEFLEEEKAKIGNPDHLGEVIKNVVWEQFINQIATTAGEDFIKDNNGLRLDLRDEAHIQTAENFEYGNLATHNTKIDYKEKYSEYRENFRTDKDSHTNEQMRILNGEVKTARYNDRTQTFERLDKDTKEWIGESRYNDRKKVWEEYDRIDGEWKKVLKDDSIRKPYDSGRDVGRNGKHNDHQIAAGTIIRDPEAAAFMTQEERVTFATSDVNMHDLDGAANISKSDHDGEKWAKHVRTQDKGKGQTNAEYFGLDEQEFLENDWKAKEKYKKEKTEAEEKAIAAGKQSRKEEVFRIGGKALRAVLMQLLAELVKEIIGKLVKWFKSTGKKLQTLLDSLKEAIKSFVGKLKTHLINAGDTVLTTIFTAIFGPVVNTVKKVVTLLKQGWKSLKEAIAYIKSPESKGMPIGLLILEVGKIVTGGLSAVGAIVLGEVFEKALLATPGAGAFFAFEIPLIGSLANILGIFLGAVVAGIIGAIAINMIDKAITNKKLAENRSAKFQKGNEILVTQVQLRSVKEAQVENTKMQFADSVSQRHAEASAIINNAVQNILSDNKTTDEDITIDQVETFDEIENSQKECDKMLDDINALLDGLL